jgi:hypothetical protein
MLRWLGDRDSGTRQTSMQGLEEEEEEVRRRR